MAVYLTSAANSNVNPSSYYSATLQGEPGVPDSVQTVPIQSSGPREAARRLHTSSHHLQCSPKTC